MQRGDNKGTESFLQRMARLSVARATLGRRVHSEESLRQQAAAAARPVPLHLGSEGFDLIAELKRRSPAEGELATAALNLEDQVGAYTQGGAAVLSVLTEPDEFKGSLADLEQVVALAGTVPVMRKDFLMDPIQISEARISGASGVLLISAILDRVHMLEMISSAHELGLFVLMEVFDRADLEHCMPLIEAIEPVNENNECRLLLGVNCRDLRTLQVSPDRFDSMVKYMPADIPWVAESGVTSAAQAQHVAELGYSLALVGTALMCSDDPAASVQSFVDAGRCESL
jgi:indole-3-glycerol phosphate synthase